MKPSRQPNQFSAFAVTAPGLEAICAAELATLGIRGKAQDGGVAWTGTLDSIAKANLWLRTASRVIVRVAEFRATAFFELELQAKKIPWTRFVARGTRVGFRVTCRKSKLYHSDAVAERFAAAVSRVPGVVTETTKASDDDDSGGGLERQLFIVRFVHDVCTVSVDTSGALLHRRGYRQQLAKAPLRETLAAAILLGAGWTGDVPFEDPMCGSGTIPIEAALIARRIAPGIHRDFAFQRWPDFDPEIWTSLVTEARASELPRSPVEIHGADRDAGAIDAARANAERAGVAGDVQLDVQPVSALADRDAPGLIASNPPYGVRVGEADRLRNLYAQFGNVVRSRRDGWTVALLTSDRQLERQTGLDLEERFRTKNGGIPVHLVTALVD